MGVQVRVREYSEQDVEQLDSLDKRCEMGDLAFDFLGDPLCRVRHLPVFHMLVRYETNSFHILVPRRCSEAHFKLDELQVAEVGDVIVGVIRGSVKDVVCSQSALICSQKARFRIPIYSRVGYLLGLRVCPSHR